MIAKVTPEQATERLETFFGIHKLAFEKETTASWIRYTVTSPSFQGAAMTVEVLVRKEVEARVIFNESVNGMKRFRGFTPKNMVVIVTAIQDGLKAKFNYLKAHQPPVLSVPVPPFIKVSQADGLYRVQFDPDMPGLQKHQLERLLRAFNPGGLLDIPESDEKRPEPDIKPTNGIAEVPPKA